MTLRTLCATLLGTISVFGATHAVSSPAPETNVTPKYIFYYIGDGMGMGQVMGAEVYNRTVLGNDTPILMMQFPTVATSTTWSASSPVTDSAAAGTALACGVKTHNGMLGMDADSVPAQSIARRLADEGFGIGIVTSVYPDDATPGAFYTHVPSRSMYYEIGRDAAQCGYDFIGGSNLRGLKHKDGTPTDLMQLFADNGVRVVRGAEQFDTITSRRVLMLSPDSVRISNIGYTIDSIPGALTLPVMTQACLDHLLRNGHDSFFMMVEGGNIDHAGHANDAGTIIKEVLNFQEALQIAYDFYLAHPDETLIVVTADHETGGMGLGNNAVGYNLHLKYYDSQRISKDEFAEYCRSIAREGREYSWEEMRQFLTDRLGFWSTVPVNERQTEMLRKSFDKCMVRGEGADLKTLYNSFNSFTVDVFKVLDSMTGVGFTTGGHSGGLVPVYAIGVGADNFKGFNDNTNIPARIMQIVRP